MSEPGTSLYAALAAGDPDALARCRIAPGIAALALAARKKRLTSAPTSPKASAPPRAPASVTSVRPTTAPRPSLADIHGPSINESRKRAGLAPLTSAELEREFADVDREPMRTMTKKSARRAAANAMAARQGLRTDQATIDIMWSDISARHNASLPARRPSGERAAVPGSVKPSQSDIDSMWGSISSQLNADAGLKSPAR
jgi:hypothetical protein